MAGILVRVGVSNGRFTVSFPGRVVECGAGTLPGAVRDAAQAWRRVLNGSGPRPRPVARRGRRR